MQVVKGKDANGNDVQIMVDLSKGLIVEDIPTNMEWNLKTIDEVQVSNTVSWIGGREKRG